MTESRLSRPRVDARTRTWPSKVGRRGWRLVAPVAVFVIASLLAACEGGPSADAGDGGRSADAGDGGRSAGAEAAIEPDRSERPETLSDLLGFSGSRDDVARNVREMDRTRQEVIRACMEKQGFDYVVHVTAGAIESPQGLPTDLSEEEFRRRFGYGIATGFEAGLSRPAESAPDIDTDPNAAIVAAMSSAERGAYERALHGEAGPQDEPQGCEGEGLRATDRAGRVVEEFGDELAEFTARVDADSRVVAAERAWAECMADAGYPYSDEAAVQEEIFRRLNPLNDAVVGSDTPVGVVDVVPGATLTVQQQALLAELRAFELAVANADQDCRQEMDDVRREVRAEYEAEFLDEHRDRIRDLLPGGGL